jgi:hypothetical protein
MKNKLDFRAVILGSTADLLSSTLFAFLFSSLASIELSSHGLSDNQMQDHLLNWTKSPEGFGYMLFFGLCFTFFGGHIAMKVSKHKSLYNALFVGVVSIITSIFTGDNGTLVQSSMVFLLPIPAALLGGYNYLRKWNF